MTAATDLEAKLIRSLRGLTGRQQLRAAENTLSREAREYAARGRHAQAGASLAALCFLHPEDAELALKAAQSYQRAGEEKRAAKLFLQAAEQYARIGAVSQAAVTLRLYRELQPEDTSAPRHIYRLFLDRGEPADALIGLLSERDNAALAMRHSPLFEGLDDDTFFRIVDATGLLRLKAGETLMHLGAEAHSLFLVISGSLNSFLELGDKPRPLGRIERGDICGEIGFFSGGRRTAKVVAETDSRVLEIPYALLREFGDDLGDLLQRLEAMYRWRMLVKHLTLNPFLGAIDAGIRREMARQMRPIQLKAGELIFREGQRAGNLFIILRGEVGIHLSHRGSEHLFKTLTRGDILGEIAVIQKGLRSASARALSDVSLRMLPADIYAKMVSQSKPLQQALIKRRNQQMEDTRKFLKQLDQTALDDTCEIVLRDILDHVE